MKWSNYLRHPGSVLRADTSAATLEVFLRMDAPSSHPHVVTFWGLGPDITLFDPKRR